MLSVVMLSVVMLSVVMLSVVMLSVVMLSVVMLSVVMLSVVTLSVVMLSVVMLSDVMLIVVAPVDKMQIEFLLLGRKSRGQSVFILIKTSRYFYRQHMGLCHINFITVIGTRLSDRINSSSHYKDAPNGVAF